MFFFQNTGIGDAVVQEVETKEEAGQEIEKHARSKYIAKFSYFLC